MTEKLRAKLARWKRSARRLPARLSHAGRVGIQIVSWAATLQLRAGLKRRRDARLIRRSGLFDREFYLAQCPGDRDARRDPVDHYLRVGASRGLDPSPLFHGAAYLRRNPDAAGENPLVHVIRSGRGAADLGAPPQASLAERFRSEPLLLGTPFPSAAPGEAVLVVAGRASSPRSDAGRVAALAQVLRDLGRGVTVVEADGAPAHLAERGPGYGAVLLAGPADAARTLAAVRAYAPRATVAYQTAALPAMLAEARLAGDVAAAEEMRASARLEQVNVACADVVLVRTPQERDRVVAQVPGQRVEVIPSVGATAERGDDDLAVAMVPIARGRLELALGIGGAAAEEERGEALAAPARAGREREEPGARATPARAAGADRSVLAVGVYLSDRPNNAAEIARELARSERWKVEQRWIALGRSAPSAALAAVTAGRERSRVPKFVLLNRLLRDHDRHAFVLVCDDDIGLPEGFVDRYLELVERHDLALAQPARTHDSHVDHPIVERLDGLAARATRFVEIGPLFSMRRDAARLLTPFDESSPMGWGYDFAWPVTMERAALRMGIVDATPIAHNLRPPVSLYDDREAAAAMRAFLDARPHLSPDEAFSIVEAYPET